MVAVQIENVEHVLENWLGDMAVFVVNKQIAVAEVDLMNPSKESLNYLVDLIETKCLVKMMDSSKVVQVKKDLKKAIETPALLEKEEIMVLNTKIRSYLRKKFGDVAVHTMNTQKKELGIEEIRSPLEYLKLAEEIYSILSDMVDEELAKEVYDGMVNIIKEAAKKGD